MDPIEVFDSIIYGKRHPKKLVSVTDDSFRVMIDKIKYLKDDPKLSYKLEITKPKNLKTRYYKKLIDYCKVSFIISSIEEIENAKYKDQDFYLYDEILHSQIEPKIIDCCNILNNIPFSPSHDMIDYQLKSVLKPSEGYEDYPYIFEYLLNSLNHIYIEVQNKFSNLCNEDLIEFNDYKEGYLSPKFMREKELLKVEFSKKHKNPKPQPITEEHLGEVISTTERPEEESRKVFKHTTDDLKPPPKKILTYQQIIKKPDWFSRFEKQLFDFGCIDEEYRFTDRHGDKQVLAAIYHQLIFKNYFNERTFKPTKAITSLHIRKFLDNRYGTDLDKQFRNLANDQAKLYKIIDKYAWVSNLATC